MTESDLIYYASQSMYLVLVLSLPVVLTTTIVGLLVGLFQALTQIQDQSLPFGIKLVAVIFVFILTASWLGQELLAYATKLMKSIPYV